MTKKNSKEILHMHSPFSFVCDRCSQCCRNKLININPYEISRLAKGLGITTTEFIRQFTQDGGIHLLQKDDGSCYFLSRTGCQVHKNRPFVCRLFPLGRHGDEHGGEYFFILPLDESCRKNLGKQFTVQKYLQNQGAMEYYQATLSYLKLFSLLSQKYQKEVKEYLITQGQENPETDTSGTDMPDLMDIDGALHHITDEAEQPLPENPWQKTLLHIRMIEEQLDTELKGDKR